MKKYIYTFLWVVMAVLGSQGFTSCTTGEDEGFDQPSSNYSNSIVGKWQEDSTGDYFRFESTGYGVYWSPSDGVTEEMASSGSGKFQWEIKNGNKLYINHYMETTGSYGDPDPDASPMTILSITTTSMKGRSADGSSMSFTRK